MKIVDVVKESWNKIANEYYSFRDLKKMDSQLEKFSSLLPRDAFILDAGTGAGIPAAKFLVDKGFNVLGIDISDTMIEIAKKNIPNGQFIRKDILELDFEDQSFDGILCVYTLWHIPKDKHESIFTNFHRMLKKNGILMINTGIRESDNLSLFYGQPMLWSNLPTSKTLELIKQLAFDIIFEGNLILGGEHQYWIIARK